MELRRTEQGFALYKEKDCIGECTLSPTPKGAQLTALCILPRWRRKGYGSYLLKEVLRSFGGYDREAATVFTAPLPENAAELAFWGKFGYTAFLCGLTAPAGRVLAFDVQPEAIRSTRTRLEQANVPAERYSLVCGSHADLLQYVQPGTADAVMFNFGWLPGADHGVFSTAQSSIPALQAALQAVRPGGIVSAILYSGAVIGSDEKQAVLRFLRALPLKSFTVLVCDFANWAETAPLPCLILKK